MVIAYHSTIGMYGFWLPNDPRGSYSNYVGAEHLLPFGHATKVVDHRSHAHDEHNRELRLRAKQSLKYPAVNLTFEQIQSVARGFGNVVRKTGARVYQCSIVPDHAHLVVLRHHYPIEQLVILLKGGATEQLKRDGLHPLKEYADANGKVPKVFQRDAWNVFLETENDIARCIDYDRKNLIRAGMAPQHWDWVTAYG